MRLIRRRQRAQGARAPARSARRILPAGTDSRIAAIIERWFDILQRKGERLPPESHMPDLVAWVAAKRPDLTHFTAEMALQMLNHKEPNASRWLGAPVDGLVRLNENQPLGQAVGLELDHDHKETGAWHRRTGDYALLARFRRGVPVWTATVEPLEAQTSEAATIIFDARGANNQPVDDRDFDRLFGHTWLGADSWGEYLPPALLPMRMWDLTAKERGDIWRWAHSTGSDLRGMTKADALDMLERRRRRKRLARVKWD